MTIVFFSNFLNHHQKLVADALYASEGIDYTFVETKPMDEWLKKGGYSDYSHEPYVLRAWESVEMYHRAIELAKTVDVALFGGPEVLPLAVIRAKNTMKLSFEVSERWLKRGWLNLLSPRLWKSIWFYQTLFKYRPFYKLCASAFGASDQYKLNSYKERCYKWGYFTVVDEQFDIESYSTVSDANITTLMWCSRFITLKHPELPILMAKRLKDKQYLFHLDMFGSGEKLDLSKRLVEDLGLGDVVSFKGNVPNSELLQEMRKHQIFLFTSDQNEGWGAVANESLANGCVLVGSDAIGSVPFLVEDGNTGLMYKSANVNTGFKRFSLTVDDTALQSLTEKVEWLLKNPNERLRLAINGYKNMRDIWSPTNAAKNLLTLVDCLIKGRESPIKEGPCSKAVPI